MTQSEYYHRDRGSVCYSLPVFAAAERPYRRLTDVFREALLATDLEWCWRGSVRKQSDLRSATSLRAKHPPLTLLSAETVSEFTDDVQYIDEWDNGKGIELFAYDRGKSSSIIDEYDLRLRVALDHFVACEGGPLRLVIITLDDQENSLVNVPHEPIPFVESLLEAWNASWVRMNARRKYKSLGMVKLETIYSLPLIHE